MDIYDATYIRPETPWRFPKLPIWKTAYLHNKKDAGTEPYPVKILISNPQFAAYIKQSNFHTTKAKMNEDCLKVRKCFLNYPIH